MKKLCTKIPPLAPIGKGMGCIGNETGAGGNKFVSGFGGYVIIEG